MNKAYKLVWNKARNCYMAVAEFARSHSKDSRSLVVSGIKGTRIALGVAAVLGTTFFAGPAFDLESKAEAANVVLEGTGTVHVYNFNYYGAESGNAEATWSGGRFTIAEDSFRTAVENVIGSSGGTSGLTGITAGDGISVTTSGTTATVAAKAGTGITVDTNGISITAGSVASGNENAITGGTAYTELRPSHNGNYVKTANTTAANLTALDDQVKANADALDEMADGLDGKANVDLDNITDNGKQVIKDLVATDLDGKANVDASNVTDAQAWADKIGTGTVTADDTKLVTGKTVYDALHDPDGSIEVKEVKAQEGDFTNLTAENADITNLTAEEADITNLKAENADITKLTAEEGDITNLTSENADITNLTADKAEIDELHVTGESKLDGNVTMGKDLTVEGNTNLKDTVVDGTLEVNKEATFHDNVTMDKDLAVTGNANIGEDLFVEGVSNLHNTNVKGDLSVTGKSHFEDNVTMDKDLDVAGNGSFGGDLNVDGNASIGKDLVVEGTSDLKGDVTMESNAEIGKDLHVVGTSQLDGDTTVGTDDAPAQFNVKGNAEFGTDGAEGTGAVTIGGEDAQNGVLTVNGTANITGDTSIGGDLTVDGKSNLKDTVVDGDLEVTGDSNIGGNETVKGNFTVEGDTNLKNTNVDGDLYVAGDSNIDGSQTIKKDLTVDGNSNIGGDQYIGGNLEVDGDSKFNGNVDIAKDLHVEGDAVVDGVVSAQDVRLPSGSLNNKLHDMDNRMDKIGAGAAALAGLHYHDYRPGQKFNMAMGVGNYKSKTATAIGGQYHFDRNTSMNLAATFGNGENMVAGGITFSFGTPKSEYQKDNDALRKENKDLAKRLAKLEKWAANFNLISQKKSAFPDIPTEHWARNAAETLKGNGYVQGYPDGEFKGDRRMTRYEYAQMLYNALSRGAKVEESHLAEYAPELRQIENEKKAVNEQKNTVAKG